jgi:hypothetical protein
MNFESKWLSFEEARQTDMIDYQSKLGYEPVKVGNSDYWYLSPLREEKTASFKVNRKLNRWYDHGLGKGGNIIDFGIAYHQCTIVELLQKFATDFSFHPHILRQSPEQLRENDESKIKIIKEGVLSSFALVHYLEERRIPIDIAKCFCKEVKYELNGKEYFSIGFKNDSGGYEIRNPYSKASSSPKDVTTFNNNAKEAVVFEGFTHFLSFMTIQKNQQQNTSDFVILNSVSFFEKARPFMEQHDVIKLYLDQDTTGQNYSRYALSLGDKYKDESHLYQHYKDLNDLLVKSAKAQKKKLGQRLY